MTKRVEWSIAEWNLTVHFQAFSPYFQVGFDLMVERCGGFLELRLFGAHLYLDCYKDAPA